MKTPPDILLNALLSVISPDVQFTVPPSLFQVALDLVTLPMIDVVPVVVNGLPVPDIVELLMVKGQFTVVIAVP